MQVVATTRPGGITHSTARDSLADILERVLDKGLVIAGDIRVQVGEVELLSIHLRLLVASVDKAKELGIDWWEGNPFLTSLRDGRVAEAGAGEGALEGEELEHLRARVEELEARLARRVPEGRNGPPRPAGGGTE